MFVTVRTAAIAAVALALSPLAARAADLKFGYVDLQRALEEIDEGKVAKAQLKKDFDEKQKQLDQRTNEVKRLDVDFQRQSMDMAPLAKAAKAAEIERKKVEVQQFVVGLQKDLAGRERELTRGVIDKMVGMVRELAEAEGFTMVLDRNTVLYASASLDVTNELVRKYNARFGSGKKDGAAGGMARLPGGTYTMGQGKTATVAPFLLDVTEVTVSAYAGCVKAGRCAVAGATVEWANITADDRAKYSARCNGGRGDRQQHAMNCVDWNQAVAYCEWLGKRLPTEEEWEWASRGAERGTTYPWGNEAPGNQLCWDGEGSDLGEGNRSSACAVGSYARGDSPHGVKDLAGNVWEWTSSASDASSRVIRGGGWGNDDPRFVSAATRDGTAPDNRDFALGFRCARTP
jgi:outer membrane protein